MEGHHEGIVDPETFEMAQMEMRRRKKNNMRYQSISIFSAKLLCGECGCFYGPRIWHSNDKYRKEVWQRNKKYQNARICSTPAVTEAEIKAFFLKAINRLVGDKKGVLEELELLRQMTCNTDSLKAEETAVAAEMESIYKDSEKMISRNAMAAQNQAGYNEKYGKLISQYEELQALRNELTEQISTARVSGEFIRNMIQTIEEMDGVVTEFQENLWVSTVESMTFLGKGRAMVRFKGGLEVEVETE